MFMVLNPLFLPGKEQVPKEMAKPLSMPSEQPKDKLMSSPVVVRLADVNIYQVYFYTNH